MPGLVRFARDEPEGRRQSSEFRRRNKGEVDLQSAREQEYAINPRASIDVEMIQSLMLIVHMCRPFGQNIRQLAGISNTKGEIYIRPSIFA